MARAAWPAVVARALAALAATALLSALVACGGPVLRWEPDYYVVRAGDTLYAIAWRHGLDYRELARWNGIDDPSLIFPGQRLRLAPPGARDAAVSSRPEPGLPAATVSGPPPPAPASPRDPAGELAPDWHWPADGQVIATFGDPKSVGKGIDIGGRMGDPVYAAAPGRVVYSGSGLIGYGRLIIIKHNDTYLSAYGHNNTLLVQQGDDVRSGQRVAMMGEGPGQRPVLHFEIRRNGTPVDPLRYLPRR